LYRTHAQEQLYADYRHERFEGFKQQRGVSEMIKVIDDEKEYSLCGSGSLMVQDLQDPDDCVQVDAKEFSSFERSVWWFLFGESK
jgi:hypothetical protein